SSVIVFYFFYKLKKPLRRRLISQRNGASVRDLPKKIRELWLPVPLEICMKQICGYVLVKETNSGVPNLVVTAYDCEKSIEEIIADHREKNGASLEKLGKRIGSVLTDQDGKFTLKSNELEFQGNESRPDLLIVILAPEDIQGIDDPFPLSQEKRVLYMSTVPRTDAGA